MKEWILRKSEKETERRTLAMARTVVTHGATGMATMELRAKSFGGLVSWVEGAWKEGDNEITAGAPFLNGEVLDVNMASTDSGTAVIDHGNGGLVVNVNDGGTKRKIAEFREDRAKIFCCLGRMNSGDEFGLGGGGGTGGLKFGLISDGAAGEHENVTGDRAASAEVSGMSGINVAHKLKERREREGTEGRIKGGLVDGNDGKVGERRVTPVEEAPGTGLAKILADLFEGDIMLVVGRGTEATEKGNCVADVGLTEDISIGEFAEELAIRVTHGALKGLMGSCTFDRTRDKANEDGAGLRGHRDEIGSVTGVGGRCLPTMSLEHAADVGLTVEFGVGSSLVNVETIVLAVEATGAKSAGAQVASSDTFIDEGNQLRRGSEGAAGDSEVVHLPTNKDEGTIDETTIKIALVGGRVEAKFINKNSNNHPFPETTSLRMSLECTFHRNDVGTRVEDLLETFEIPRSIGLIDFEEAGSAGGGDC